MCHRRRKPSKTQHLTIPNKTNGIIMRPRVHHAATLAAAVVVLSAVACEAFTSRNRPPMAVRQQHRLRRHSAGRLSLRSPPSPSSPTRLFLSDEPSDTSSDSFYDDDVVMTVESESFAPTDAEVLVTSVLDLIPSLVASASEEKRAEINEVLLKLEALNPTPKPAMSPLLNGVWELYVRRRCADVAVGRPGLSFCFSLVRTRMLAILTLPFPTPIPRPLGCALVNHVSMRTAGTLGCTPPTAPFCPSLPRGRSRSFCTPVGTPPASLRWPWRRACRPSWSDVGALGISISREQPRVEARVKVKSMLLGESSVVVKARLDVVSDIRLRETYESATVLGQNVAIPDFLQYSRELYVTYVDEDLLVVRDASGVPELLVRKEKDFTRNWGTEPTSVDDELAPGEELDAIM